jgi:hypothetical protein
VSISQDSNGTFLRNKLEPIFFREKIGEEFYKEFSGLNNKLVWISTEVKAKKTVGEIIEIFYKNKFNSELKVNNFIVSDKDWSYEYKNDIDSKVNLEKWKGNEIILNYQSKSPSFLFLPLNYDGHWRASIEGSVTPLDIFQANIGNSAIYVPAGSGKIFMKYQNELSNIVFILRLLTILFSALCMIFIIFNKKLK